MNKSEQDFIRYCREKRRYWGGISKEMGLPEFDHLPAGAADNPQLSEADKTLLTEVCIIMREHLAKRCGLSIPSPYIVRFPVSALHERFEPQEWAALKACLESAPSSALWKYLSVSGPVGKVSECVPCCWRLTPEPTAIRSLRYSSSDFGALPPQDKEESVSTGEAIAMLHPWVDASAPMEEEWLSLKLSVSLPKNILRRGTDFAWYGYELETAFVLAEYKSNRKRERVLAPIDNALLLQPEYTPTDIRCYTLVGRVNDRIFPSLLFERFHAERQAIRLHTTFRISARTADGKVSGLYVSCIDDIQYREKGRGALHTAAVHRQLSLSDLIGNTSDLSAQVLHWRELEDRTITSANCAYYRDVFSDINIFAGEDGWPQPSCEQPDVILLCDAFTVERKNDMDSADDILG